MNAKLLLVVPFLAIACSSGESVGVDPSSDEPVAELGQAATATVAPADAKLFGYIFGDGDYYTDSPPPANPTFFTGNATVALDVAELACLRGYTVDLGGTPVKCAKVPTLPGDGTGQFQIHGFAWPHNANLAQMTKVAELKAFFSGLIIGEGSRSGLVDDQSPNNPAGHYPTGASCAAHVQLVSGALKRAGFTTAHVSAKDDAPCSGDTCREARVGSSEFCKFSTSNGYTFVVFSRVPGAKASGNSYVGPLACN